MRVFDVYEAVGLEKATTGGGPRLAVGIRSFEAPYFADLALYRDSVDLCVSSGELIAAAAIHYCHMEADRVVSVGGGVHPPKLPLQQRPIEVPIRLLYAGRLDGEQKRMFDLPPLLDKLEALGIAFSMDIAGIGPAEAELRSRLAARVRDGSVRFLGWMQRDALYERIYPKAHCFLHFAAWEGMTIAPREAMAHGVVPVITQFSGLRAEGQFRDGENALTYPVGDTDAAAYCIRRLVQEPQLFERLSAAAQASQGGRYSFQGSMDAWSEAFERCLEQPVKMGSLPRIPTRTSGRLARLGLPIGAQDFMRALLGRRQQHSSPGSEWPTSSGLLAEDTRQALGRFAQDLDRAGQSIHQRGDQ
jgi:glycosyltransferase involved in cell wall biosynthesis